MALPPLMFITKPGTCDVGSVAPYWISVASQAKAASMSSAFAVSGMVAVPKAIAMFISATAFLNLTAP